MSLAETLSLLRNPQRRLFFHLKHFTHVIYSSYVAADALLKDLWNARHNTVEISQRSGDLAIVTGGSRGIGLEVVRMLLKCDMDVIIACRNYQAGEKAVQQIRNSGVDTGKAKVYHLDNASLQSVRNFVDKIKEDYKQLHVLVNNAGVMFTPYQETEDGFELQYETNYLSHFLLTSLLLPLLTRTGPSEQWARIVNVSSCAHYTGEINFEDINYKDNFVTSYSYAQSKLAQVLFTKNLARLFTERRLPIQIHAVHPGIVNTNLLKHLQLSSYPFLKTIKTKLLKTPEEGAIPVVFAAISPTIRDKSGLYISNCMETRVSSLGQNQLIQKKLFELSLKQLAMTNFWQSS